MPTVRSKPISKSSIPECMNGHPFLVKKGNDAGKTRIRFKENLICLSQRELKELISFLVYSLETIEEIPLETQGCLLSQKCYECEERNNHANS